MIVVGSIIGGYAFATLLAIGLRIAGLDIPALMLGTRDCLSTSCAISTYSDYGTYGGAEILLLTILFSWAMYQVISRRFLGRKADNKHFRERGEIQSRRFAPLARNGSKPRHRCARTAVRRSEWRP